MLYTILPMIVTEGELHVRHIKKFSILIPALLPVVQCQAFGKDELALLCQAQAGLDRTRVVASQHKNYRFYFGHQQASRAIAAFPFTLNPHEPGSLFRRLLLDRIVPGSRHGDERGAGQSHTIPERIGRFLNLMIIAVKLPMYFLKKPTR